MGKRGRYPGREPIGRENAITLRRKEMIVAGEFVSLDIKEAADFLGLHPDTLQARAKTGVIPGAKICSAGRDNQKRAQ